MSPVYPFSHDFNGKRYLFNPEFRLVAPELIGWTAVVSEAGRVWRLTGQIKLSDTPSREAMPLVTAAIVENIEADAS